MKRKKLSKLQKENINKVLNKWLPKHQNDNFLVKFSAGTGAVGTGLAGLDLMFFGGGGLLIATAAFYGLSAKSMKDRYAYPFTNKAGQKITAPLKVAWVTQNIEQKVFNIFNEVPKASNIKKREQRLQELLEMQEDLNILKPIMNFKPKNLNTEFKFLVKGKIKTFDDIYNNISKSRLKKGLSI